MKITHYPLPLGQEAVFDYEKSVVFLNDKRKWEKLQPYADRIFISPNLHVTELVGLKVPKYIKELCLVQKNSSTFGLFGYLK